MEQLYPITDNDKATAIDLIIYEELDKINKKANEWFDETFINKIPYIDDDILVRNLIDDVEYIFSMAFWWIEVGENMGFDFTSKAFVISNYERYKNNENGYRFLVSDYRYDPYQNKVLTPEEIKERDERMCAEIEKIMNEM